MASEVAVEEASSFALPPVDVQSAVADVPEAPKQPQKLERNWSFWFDNQSKKQGAAWGTSLRKVYSFDTVEEFWGLYDQIFKPSKLTVNADFHLFKTGVEPKWEDPECANGGKWTVSSNSKSSLDNMWLETLMALIGEQFDETDEICGVVASVRQRGDRLSLWTKNAANEAVQLLTSVARVTLEREVTRLWLDDVLTMGIGRKWKEVIDVADKINYSFHDDSRRERSSKGRYSV